MFTPRKLQKKYDVKGKFLLCFVDLKKHFNRIPRKVLKWAMMMEEIPDSLLRSVINQSIREQTSEWIKS